MLIFINKLQALKIFTSINALERELPHGAFGLVHRQQLKEYLLSCKGGNIPSGPSFSAITINSIFETLEVNSDDQIQISDLVDYLRQFEVYGEISKIYAPIFQLSQIIEKNIQIWIRNNKQQMDEYINNREFQQELRSQNIMEIFKDLGLNCTLLDAVAIMNQIGDYNNVENQDGQKVCTEIAFWKYIDSIYSMNYIQLNIVLIIIYLIQYINIQQKDLIYNNIIMEGYLKKWINIVTRWQDRYFILNDHILHYCERQGGQSKGQIHLKVAEIILVPEDPLRIIINTGTNEIQLRASNVPEKIQWVNALKRAQESCQETIPRDYIKEVNDILTDIWVTQAAFDETLNMLVPKLVKQPKYVELAEKLSELGQKIKMNVTICTQLLEVEKEKLETQQSVDNQTLFQSFRNITSRIDEFNRQSSAISCSNSLSIQDILESLKYEQPIKYKNLINNPVFQKIQFTNQQLRIALPRTQDPNEKLKVWSLIKDLIGKDLSKFAVPVYFNEPLSMLQRLAENLEYYQTLIDANQEQDQWLRMCYVMGFGVSAYSSNIDRHKKPFNPILGETFEIQNKQFRFVSEQVSHHPPISAGYAESNDFEMQMQTDLKTKMSPRTMEVQPIGNVYIKLKQFNDQISYNKCITKVHNIIFGNMYIEHIGDMIFHNYATNDKGVLTLSENNKMVGTVYDSNGKEKYKLKGQWNDSLIAHNVQTGQEVVVWQRYDLPQDYKSYFFFTKFALNLNLLNIDLIKQLPCTDCRLRPDQLALEYGFIDLAADEKHRLEQKQRQRRKDIQIAGQKHTPQFFELIKEPCTNEMIYKYKGNYWRKKGEGLDLF